MYCNASDVASLIGISNFSNNTNPTEAIVNNLITMLSGEVDFFAKQYNIKFDTTHNLLLKKKVAMGVAGIVLLTYMNNNQTAGSQTNEYLREYRDFLANIGKFLAKKSSSNVIDKTEKEGWWGYDYYEKV